jgi:hypothetical protein
MALPRFALLALAVAAIAGASGCGKDATRPGESIGAFGVSAKLVSTTCGATPDPWKFDVRLRYEQNTLYWVQGDAPISGQVDQAAHASLTSTDVREMRGADARSQTAACNMSRDDVLDLVLAPLAGPVSTSEATSQLAGVTSFKGTLTYHFAATEGSSCEDQLTDLGGDFAAIPCDVKYELEGTRTGDAK